MVVLKIIFLLGVLIVMHEYAHYIVARWAKVKVYEFSIGFGKKIFSKAGKDGTVYTLRLVPLGGYVKLKGMDDESKDKDSYTQVPIWKRICIISAGGVVNFVFGIIVFFILMLTMTNFTGTLNETGIFLTQLVDNLRLLFTGQVMPDQFIGPVGIGDMISQTEALKEYIYLLALISVSFGITNLLPIPPLDGSKIVLLIIEKIIRKPINQNVEIMIHFIGFIFIIGLSLFILYNDIMNII